MSKLFGKVGRVDNGILVQTFFVHTRVGSVDLFWTYVQNFIVFLGPSPYNITISNLLVASMCSAVCLPAI